MKPQNTPPCRLSLVFASEAPIAVVLRRGPTDWVEVVKWDTSRDTFEHGPWLHGRIYEERCGLSPNGRLFVYFAAKWGKVRREEGYASTFTAVSKPPYLTALAMWPEGSTWGGGGRFIDNKTLCLAYGSPGIKHHPNHSPGPLTIQWNVGRDYGGYSPDQQFRSDPSGYPEADWTGKDQGGRRVFTRAGVLYALSRDGREQVLKDFNADERRGLASPDWAKVW